MGRSRAFATMGVILALLFVIFAFVKVAPNVAAAVGSADGQPSDNGNPAHVSRDVNTTVTSLPTTSNKTAAQDYYYCTASTFHDVTSGASPLKADCATMVHNIVGGGDWTFTSQYQHQLIQYQTCAFGVETVGDDVPLGDLITMSSLDIQYNVNRSVNDFARNSDRIGTWGETQCPVKLQTELDDDVMIWVKWGIYGNSG